MNMKTLGAALCLLAVSAQAFAQSKLAGNWEGKISAGGKDVRLVFRVKESNGKLSATMDSPDQGVTGIGVQNASLNNDTALFDMSSLGIQYKGLLMGDEIVGAWFQGGASIPLEMKRTEKPAEIFKPQTPQPPFSYTSEEVTYQNADKSMTYGATITIPKDGKTHPAMILISGSGSQNRDGEIKGHKPFMVIADYLTKKGYIVLRVDDRGMGGTTVGGNPNNLTSLDFAKDVSTGLDYLKTRKEVNTKKLGMIGHSEGGMIAPMVAADRKDVDFIIMLAGPGIKVYEMMEDQNAAIMQSGGVSESVVNEYRKLYRGMEQAAIAGTSGEDAKNRMIKVTTAWKPTASKEALELTGLNDFQKERDFIDEFMMMYHNKWLNYFLKYDPQPTLQKLSCKVLALNGEKDVQVLAKSNLAGIQASLQKSKSKSYETKELPGLNHLFQTCKQCNTAEYGDLDETFSPTALQTIGDWLDKKVK
ncbi:MAG: alpha/beta fold hydrolase [Bacteroidetes bacterium]|nr:alpha/beta fold hydrolase [Bacteroidota bacterium]